MAKIEKTLGYDCLRISTPCIIDAKDYERVPNSPAQVLCDRADWDTGATVSVISERLVEQLGLVPVGKTKICGYNGKPTITNEYRIDLKLSENVAIDFVNVVEAPLVTMDLLIGMNVINQGDFMLNFRKSPRSFIFEID